jgi:hypothetical protein
MNGLVLGPEGHMILLCLMLPGLRGGGKRVLRDMLRGVRQQTHELRKQPQITVNASAVAHNSLASMALTAGWDVGVAVS